MNWRSAAATAKVVVERGREQEGGASCEMSRCGMPFGTASESPSRCSETGRATSSSCEFACPIDLMWELPQLAAFMDTLGGFARVIAFDLRGQGASDPVLYSGAATVEMHVDARLAHRRRPDRGIEHHLRSPREPSTQRRTGRVAHLRRFLTVAADQPHAVKSVHFEGPVWPICVAHSIASRVAAEIRNGPSFRAQCDCRLVIQGIAYAWRPRAVEHHARGCREDAARAPLRNRATERLGSRRRSETQ